MASIYTIDIVLLELNNNNKILNYQNTEVELHEYFKKVMFFKLNFFKLRLEFLTLETLS